MHNKEINIDWLNKKCVFCKKTGHFPKSLRCKKFRKTNIQLTSQQQFPNSEDKGKIESFDFEGKCQQKENEAVLMRKRCPKCFITHFPYPKFCQWAKSSERKKEILPDITNELKDIIETKLNCSRIFLYKLSPLKIGNLQISNL